MLKGIGHPKMKIVINYSPSCRSNPVRPSFIFEKQMKIFLIIKDPNMIKAQERSKDSVKIILTMSLLCFWAFISWGGSESSQNYQTYLHLCSEDEQMSYGFGTTWGWIINESIFIFGWTIPLTDKVMEKCGAKKVIKSRHIIRLKPEIMLDDSGWCVCCDTFSTVAP